MSRSLNQQLSFLYERCKEKTKSKTKTKTKSKPNKFVDPSYGSIMVHSDKLLIDTMHLLNQDSPKFAEDNKNSNTY